MTREPQRQTLSAQLRASGVSISQRERGAAARGLGELHGRAVEGGDLANEGKAHVGAASLRCEKGNEYLLVMLRRTPGPLSAIAISGRSPVFARAESTIRGCGRSRTASMALRSKLISAWSSISASEATSSVSGSTSIVNAIPRSAKSAAKSRCRPANTRRTESISMRASEGADLRRMNFRGTKLAYAHFGKSDMRPVKLANGMGQSVTLAAAQFAPAQFTETLS
jgi:hypothetical protein